MAKEDKKVEAATTEALEMAVAPPSFEELVAPPQTVSFERWFASTGKPDHWKHGMRAFAPTSGKKTIAAWAAIFKTY